jgi:hypothetical protein
MIDAPALCKHCHMNPVPPRQGPHKREYCSDACRQAAWRERQDEKRYKRIRPRFASYSAQTQAILEAVMRQHEDVLDMVLAALDAEKPDRPFKAWLRSQRGRGNPLAEFAVKAWADPQFPERGTEATYCEYIKAHTLPYGQYSNWEGEAGLHNAWLNFQEHERQA